MALIDRDRLRESGDFQGKVRMAITAAAYDFAVFVPAAGATDEVKKKARIRRYYAEQVLREPEAHVNRWCAAIAAKATDAQVTNMTDTAVTTLVNAGWDAFAMVEQRWQSEVLPA